MSKKKPVANRVRACKTWWVNLTGKTVKLIFKGGKIVEIAPLEEPPVVKVDLEEINLNGITVNREKLTWVWGVIPPPSKATIYIATKEVAQYIQRLDVLTGAQGQTFTVSDDAVWWIARLQSIMTKREVDLHEE